MVEPSPFGNPPPISRKVHIQAVPLDPWGNDYAYDCPPFAGIRMHYKLQSLGADATEGGEGENADIKRSYPTSTTWSASTGTRPTGQPLDIQSGKTRGNSSSTTVL